MYLREPPGSSNFFLCTSAGLPEVPTSVCVPPRASRRKIASGRNYDGSAPNLFSVKPATKRSLFLLLKTTAFIVFFFIVGTSRDVRRPEQQEQQENKVWRPPATAESSHTASLARTTRARSRNRNRFPGWGRMRSHPPTSNLRDAIDWFVIVGQRWPVLR